MIYVKDMVKVYDKKMKALDGVSFHIIKGEIFGLLGPNGAGKTTLLHILATLLPPTSGSAMINGFDVVEQPGRVRSSIGIVFQGPSSDDKLTGYENLKLHALMFNVPKDLIDTRIEQALELVDLKERAHDRVRKYSGGMRRRLELARGLIHRPRVLFLDEPTLGLDPQSRERTWKYILNMVVTEKITVIITTHYMEEADRLCNRVAIIDRGRIAALDTPKALKSGLGGDIIRLTTNVSCSECLDGLDFISSMEQENGNVIIKVRDAAKHLQEILTRIGKVDSVEVRSPTLDDVFMHFTGRTLSGEETGEESFFDKAMDWRAGR